MRTASIISWATGLYVVAIVVSFLFAFSRMLLVLGLPSVIMLVLRILFKRRVSAASKFDNGRILSVVFLHPDLGIGGAERLIVDAAIGLQEKRGCKVSILTNFHDPKRCFRETADGTLRIIVVGSWFPRHVMGRGLVLCATVRMVLAALWAAWNCDCDVFVVDQVAAAMPVLRLLTSSPIYFYCHFPDQLCDPNRMKSLAIGATAANLSASGGSRGQGGLRSILQLPRRLYRRLFDAVEEATMHAATRIVCNSAFTLQTTIRTFPELEHTGALKCVPKCTEEQQQKYILYPPINIEDILKPKEPTEASEALRRRMTATIDGKPGSTPLSVVSINRFERKKNVALAVKAFALVYREADAMTRSRLLLVLAGGYDPRLPENVECFQELQALCTSEGIPEDRVIFLRSFSDAEKYVMLQHAAVVVYTPSGEHFGIVPIEAMAFERCVVAVNNGGPCESITTTDVFGLLRDPDPRSFADAIEMLILSPGAEEARRIMGLNAAKRCRELFSLDAFSKKMFSQLCALVERYVG